jgi:hypothetical protein
MLTPDWVSNIVLHGADALVIHRSQYPPVVIIEYEVHGKLIATGASYDNRFISVVTIEDRKIVHWRDYMDSLTAMTALSQRTGCGKKGNRGCFRGVATEVVTIPGYELSGDKQFAAPIVRSCGAYYRTGREIVSAHH